MHIFNSLLQFKKRTICECDDPDCSGFIEEEEEKEEELEIENVKGQRNGERNIFEKIGGDNINEKITKPKINDKPHLSSIEFFDSVDNNLSSIKKKKKKKKKEADIILQDNSISKKRKNDGSTDGSSTAKKSKDLNKKYEMVFLEEDIQNQDNKDDNDDENLVENTKQSSSKMEIKPNDYISVNCVPKTGQGSIKKRIAHAQANDVSIYRKEKFSG